MVFLPLESEPAGSHKSSSGSLYVLLGFGGLAVHDLGFSLRSLVWITAR